MAYQALAAKFEAKSAPTLILIPRRLAPHGIKKLGVGFKVFKLTYQKF